MSHSKFYHIYHNLIALCLLLFMTAEAKSFVYIPLPTQSQLPVGNIHCIFEDSEGFMWYGTIGGGLCRDNGYQIDKFGKKDIICITEDQKGRIWFGTSDGLYYIDKSNYQITSTPYVGETSALLCDSKERLWASVKGNILCINPNTLQIIMQEKHIHENAATFYEDSQKEIWTLFWGKKIWKSKKNSLPQPFISSTNIKPSRIAEDKYNHGYWIATWGNGILWLDKTEKQLIPQPATTKTDGQSKILDMKVDAQRRLIYVSTLDNLYIYQMEGKNLKLVNTSSFLTPEKRILDGLWLDFTGNLWVSGFLPTTFVISPILSPLIRYTIPEITQQTGYPLIADRCIQDGNNLWISQGRIGLMLYNTLTHKLLDISDITSNSRIIEKQKIHMGIWGANGKNLLSITTDRQQGIISRNIFSFDSNICSIHDQGEFLLIGTQNALYRLQADKEQISGSIIHKITDTEKPVISSIADVDGKTYFIVKDKGLFRYSKGEKIQPLCNFSYKINCMDICSDGTLWTGTEDGKVYKLCAGKKHMELQKELCNHNGNAILDIQTDFLRHIWVLSDQTVIEMNPTTGNKRIFHSQDANIKVANFYQLEHSDGRFVGIGAAGAYLKIEPSTNLNKNIIKEHPIFITNYQVGDKTRIVEKGLDKLIIPADNSNITLYVSTNKPLEAGKISFAYRLENNNNWIFLPQGSNTIYLNNLPIGNSTLLIKATDEYGRWTEKISQVYLYHTPHWWETVWARILFLILALALLISLCLLYKQIHILTNLQNMRNRLSLNEIEIKKGHEKQALKEEDRLKEIISHIEANIADPNYNVNRLSEDMCMSRTNLYRRIHKASGLSVIEFIRDIRLKKAALILSKHPETSISAIYNSVGFTSNSYFTKCFKNKFGVTPSEYIKTNKSFV